MNKEEIKLRIQIYKQLATVIFHMLIKPALYMIVMWAFEVAAAFIFFGDLWKAMGFVSAISLYLITQHEFQKEFGIRNAIQK